MEYIQHEEVVVEFYRAFTIPSVAQADGANRGQDLERRVVGVVREQSRVYACHCHVLLALLRVCRGGVTENPVRHTLQTA